MKKGITLAAAALVLAACADRNPVAESPEISRPRAVFGPVETIYTTQTPESTLDATGGWEVGTRFSSEADGKITGFRFYKASGESGSHTAHLWTSSGTHLGSATFSNETASGWQSATLSSPIYIYAGDTYVVSVNTNVKQVKSFAYFTNHGAITHGNLTADGGYYGQPTGSFPSSSSGSSFFVDVNFREDLGPICVPSIDNPCP